MVGALHDQLRRCVAVDGVVHFVLHFGEELFRDRRVSVVVHRRGINVGNLLIKAPLRQADLPDLLQQALEVIFAEERAVLHAFPIHHIPTERVVPQDSRGPLPEGRGTLGIHAVAHRDDRIQIVMQDTALNLAFSFGLNC